LSKVKLIDAGFIWTEPHSKRLKVKLTIQKDVLNGVKLQQVFAVEFLVQNQQCDACQRSYTDHTWRASVQVRQRVEHKKTFFLLEQLILKHGMHEKCINVEQVPMGIDFFFSERSHALKFMDFLGAMVPIRHKAAKQLISEDVHTATKNYKFAYCVDVVPLCKDDVVVLPARLAAGLGNVNPVCVVSRVTSLVALLDPRSLQVGELSAEKFWGDTFRPLVTSSHLIEFTVLDITPVTIAPLQAAALRRRAEALGSAGGVKGKKARSAAGEAARAAAGARGRGGETEEDLLYGAAGDAFENASTYGANTSQPGGGGRKASRRGGGGVSLAGGSVSFSQASSSVATTVTGGKGGKWLLADAEVARSGDMGVTEEKFIVRTHLGNVLRAGDRVLGYDLTQAVYNEADAESSATGGKSATKGAVGRAGKYELPDVILVRKVFVRSKADEEAEMNRELAEGERTSAEAAGMSLGQVGLVGGNDNKNGGGGGGGGGMEVIHEKPPPAEAAAARGGGAARRARKARIWKLKRLDDLVPTVHSDKMRKADVERAEAEYESFLQDLEADPSLRKSINLYKDKEGIERRRAAGVSLKTNTTSTLALDELQQQQQQKGGSLGKKQQRSKGFLPKSVPAKRKAVRSDESDEEEEEEEEEDGEEGEDEGEDGDVDFGDVGLEELLDDLEIVGSGVGKEKKEAGATSNVLEEKRGGQVDVNDGDWKVGPMASPKSPRKSLGTINEKTEEEEEDDF